MSRSGLKVKVPGQDHQALIRMFPQRLGIDRNASDMDEGLRMVHKAAVWSYLKHYFMSKAHPLSNITYLCCLLETKKIRKYCLINRKMSIFMYFWGVVGI